MERRRLGREFGYDPFGNTQPREKWGILASRRLFSWDRRLTEFIFWQREGKAREEYISGETSKKTREEGTLSTLDRTFSACRRQLEKEREGKRKENRQKSCSRKSHRGKVASS